MTSEQNKLFYSVLESNADRLKNEIFHYAAFYSIKEGNAIRTDEETRQLAVHCFAEAIAKKVLDHLTLYRP